MSQGLYEGLKKNLGTFKFQKSLFRDKARHEDRKPPVYELCFQCFRIAFYYRNNPLAKFELASD